MENETFIKIRDNFKKIQVVNSKNETISVGLLIKLDNDAWVDDTKLPIFYDDENGIAYYYSTNASRPTDHPMTGKSKINVPGELSAFDYGEVQEVKALLTKDALILSLDKLNVFGAKYMICGKPVELTEELKEGIKNQILNASAIDVHDPNKPYRD